MKNMKGMGMLMALAGLSAMTPIPGTQNSNKARAPKKSGSKLKRVGQLIELQYPEHYTNQQRGFTPAGGAKLHFQHSNLNSNPYVIGRNGRAKC